MCDLPRFRYIFDPVCLTSVVLYLANRWLIKPSHIENWFFSGYFNDLLCIPLFLPPVLLVDRVLGIRHHDGYPTAFEIIGHLTLWSICFELIAPQFPDIYRTTADPLDVVAYTLGAAICGLVWRSGKLRHFPLLRSMHNALPIGGRG